MMHKKSETVVEGAPADFLLSEDCEKKEYHSDSSASSGSVLEACIYDKKLRVAHKCFIVH